jgi:acylphosphatase
MNDVVAVRATVSGRVQGVGYRYSARATAHRLGVQGWVRNTRHGDVEVFAQGSPDAVQAVVAWLGDGPAGAVVRNVTTTEATVDPHLRGFDIKA